MLWKLMMIPKNLRSNWIWRVIIGHSYIYGKLIFIDFNIPPLPYLPSLISPSSCQGTPYWAVQGLSWVSFPSFFGKLPKYNTCKYPREVKQPEWRIWSPFWVDSSSTNLSLSKGLSWVLKNSLLLTSSFLLVCFRKLGKLPMWWFLIWADQK